MRANFMEQQVRILESNAGGDPTAPPAPCKAATAVCKKQRGGSQGCVDEEGQKGLAGGGRMPPSEEATGACGSLFFIIFYTPQNGIGSLWSHSLPSPHDRDRRRRRRRRWGGGL